MHVPFLDLKGQYESIKEEIDYSIRKVVKDCAFIGGPFVEKFEREYAEFCNCAHAVGVGSGIEALWLTLIALGVGKGDEVITVPNTHAGTVEGILLSGAAPVFIDVEENTGHMDTAKLQEFLKFHCQRGQVFDSMVNLSTGRTVKAIVPVHLFGLAVNMNSIMEIAKEYKLKVIEDASQAPGAEFKGQIAGTSGHAGFFSFCPGGNIDAYGEAGAMVTFDTNLADAVALLRNYGQSYKQIHSAAGWNGIMDGIQGAVLSIKLKYIESWNTARRMIAEQYTMNFREVENLACPLAPEGKRHVYNIYGVRVPDRESFMENLRSAGVTSAIHYPIPIHLQEAYQIFNFKEGDFPVAEKWASQVVSLPIFPELHITQVAKVIDAVKKSRRLNKNNNFEVDSLKNSLNSHAY